MEPATSSVPLAVEAARSCSSLVSSAPWYVEPAIASGSFIVWLLFFRACELDLNEACSGKAAGVCAKAFARPA